MKEGTKAILRELLRDSEFCKAVEQEDWDKIMSIFIGGSEFASEAADFRCYLYRDLGINFLEGKDSIPLHCFYRCHSLESVNIPNSITEIGKSAFRHCTSLQSITIPNSVTEIGDYAFNNCTNLSSITIPDSVTEIGDSAFYRCDNLTVKCNKGSYAEQYCIKNEIKYEVI